MRKQSLLILTSVAISFLFVAIYTYGATTISTDISTGALTATSATISGTTALNNTVTIAASKGLTLGSSESNLASGAAGMIYYNSLSKVIKMYDGASWFTVGTSTSGITLDASRLRLSDVNYYLTIGTTTPQGLSMLTLEASTTATIPLTLVRYYGQTANLFQVQTSGGANLFALDYAGRLTTNLGVNGYATTTAATGAFATRGAIAASSTLQVTGTTRLYDTLTLANADTIANASAGAVAISGTTTMAAGAAIGTSGTPIIQVLTGTCTVNFGLSLPAGMSTTTACTANGVRADDKIFMTPAGLETYVAFSNASSTADSVIRVQVFNTSTSTILTIAPHTWYWMAVR